MNENIKKLIRFLKRQGIYNKYVEEVKKAGLPTIDATLTFCEGGPEDLLLYSFYWENTADGGQYWANIDKEWGKFLKNNK